MSKFNILITGTGGCGVGEGIYKALYNASTEFCLYSCNSTDNSLYLFEDTEKSCIVPSANKSRYKDAIFEFCVLKNIKVIIPGSEPELLVLSEHRNFFEENSIKILANSRDVIKTFDNKWEAFLKFQGLGISTPDTTLDLNDKDFFSRNTFPLIIKPIYGNASKNVFVLNNRIELETICQYFKLKKIDYVIQEYIDIEDQEYTISILSDNDGEYLGSLVLKRNLLGGFSQFVNCEKFNILEDQALEISRKIISRGPLNIQCRVKGNKLIVFEINPRFSGTTPFRALFGFNEPLVMLNKVLNNKNTFSKSHLKYGYFGVRGFSEKIYDKNIMNGIKNIS